MNPPLAAQAVAISVLLLACLPGCVTYRDCGFRGCPGDAGITAAVAAQLQHYPALQAPNSVRVQTLNHVVYLYGLVNTDLQRELAQSVATDAAHGARVVDSIAVDNLGR
jgi:osmotically-inducible protein OsmY